MIRLIREFASYLWVERKWWLIPLILALVLVGSLVVASELSPLSPFLYPFW